MLDMIKKMWYNRSRNIRYAPDEFLTDITTGCVQKNKYREYGSCEQSCKVQKERNCKNEDKKNTL